MKDETGNEITQGMFIKQIHPQDSLWSINFDSPKVAVWMSIKDWNGLKPPIAMFYGPFAKVMTKAFVEACELGNLEWGLENENTLGENRTKHLRK